MFKKPPNVKNFSVLRSSDRKKIIQQIGHSFYIDNLDSEAKNGLLPEGAQSAKFTTHLDEQGVLYYDSQGLEPLWIKVTPPAHHSEWILPTVYTLWQFPSLLKRVGTWDHVLEKLQGGADLMTPGLTGWDRKIKSGDITAVTLGNGVPMAVGVAAFDIGNLSKAAGEKGKAVYLVHCYHDELWALGTKSHPPLSHADDQASGLEESTQQLSLNTETEKHDNEPHDPTAKPAGDFGTPTQGDSVSEPSVSDVDNAFKMAAIYGLYDIKTSNKQGTISLPLTSSTYVSSHLNPYLPELFAQFNFKKTSWKKAASFLKKYLEKEGLVKTKDRGGETVISSINWDHKLIAEFEPYRVGHKEAGKSGPKDGESSSVSAYTIQIQELFKASGRVLKAILESQSKSKEELYSAAQIKDIVTQYINDNPDLVDARNPRRIKIDFTLAPLLKSTENNVEFLLRDKILERLFESSTSYYTINNGDEVQTRKGKPPKISVVLEKRQGRKTVTRFWGLEAFFVNPQEIAEELRNACATSASVTAMQTSTPKQPLREVLIQGPQTAAVIDALEKRGIKRNFIVVEDKRKN